MQSSKPFIKKYIEKLSLSVVVLLFFFAGAVFLFGLITKEVILEKEEGADHYIFDFLAAEVISPGLTPVMETITFFADGHFLKACYGILVAAYLLRKDYKRALEIGIIGIGGFLVNYFMKLFFQRPRPPHPLIEPLQNFSFPSGHATSGFIFYGLLVYLTWKTNLGKPWKYGIGAVLILLALLIGFSRIYLRMHYPSDVLAGFCIGFSWLFFSIWLLNRLKKKSGRELAAGG
jgi:undecaprenyl-diphosphatase